MSGAEARAVPALKVSFDGLTPVWRRHLIALGLAVAAIGLLFARDIGGMAAIWWTSSTYEHCLVILPIIAWLCWQRGPLLRAVTPRGWALPLLWVALGAFGWLIGEAAGVAVPRHVGVVMMLQGAVAAILGRGVTAALLFPLFYAFFLVPFGDAVVPALQTVTAKMCMALLHLFHIPATIDGVFIATPGGWFKVAEACSGAKFLIAMIALGVLVANLGFVRWSRRIAFFALCVIVPVLANGIRAFTTIWVAQYRGAEAAAGFDHVVYGWIFFGIVIAAVLAVSWRFFDRPADGVPVPFATVEREAGRQRRAISAPVALVAAIAIAATAPLWSIAVRAHGTAALPSSPALPTPAGWVPVASAQGTPWRPRFDGANRLLIQRYRDATGAEVDLAVALYTSQGEGRTLVGFGHGAVDPDSDWAWAADLPAPANAKAERIVAPGQVSRAVVSFYRIGGLVTGSPARVKIETLRHHLIGGPQDAEALLVSAPGGQEAAIDRFLVALGPVGPMLDRMTAPDSLKAR